MFPITTPRQTNGVPLNQEKQSGNKTDQTTRPPDERLNECVPSILSAIGLIYPRSQKFGRALVAKMPSPANGDGCIDWLASMTLDVLVNVADGIVQIIRPGLVSAGEQAVDLGRKGIGPRGGIDCQARHVKHLDVLLHGGRSQLLVNRPRHPHLGLGVEPVRSKTSIVPLCVMHGLIQEHAGIVGKAGTKDVDVVGGVPRLEVQGVHCAAHGHDSDALAPLRNVVCNMRQCGQESPSINFPGDLLQWSAIAVNPVPGDVDHDLLRRANLACWRALRGAAPASISGVEPQLPIVYG